MTCMKTMQTPATAVSDKWLRVRFFTHFWLRVRKKNAESCRSWLRIRGHLWEFLNEGYLCGVKSTFFEKKWIEPSKSASSETRVMQKYHSSLTWFESLCLVTLLQNTVQQNCLITSLHGTREKISLQPYYNKSFLTWIFSSMPKPGKG